MILDDPSEEVFNGNARIPQRSFECVAVNFVVKRKDDPASVGMLHLDVASLPMDFHKAKALERCEDLPSG